MECIYVECCLKYSFPIYAALTLLSFFVCILRSSFCIEAGADECGYRGCRHPHDVPCKHAKSVGRSSDQQ